MNKKLILYLINYFNLKYPKEFITAMSMFDKGVKID